MYLCMQHSFDDLDSFAASRPDGEIGRHSGLKIRRFVNSGRAGSIPARGTIRLAVRAVANMG